MVLSFLISQILNSNECSYTIKCEVVKKDNLCLCSDLQCAEPITTHKRAMHYTVDDRHHTGRFGEIVCIELLSLLAIVP